MNSGYQDLGNVEVLRAAGVKVHSLPHLAYILTNAPGPYIKLDLQWSKVSWVVSSWSLTSRRG